MQVGDPDGHGTYGVLTETPDGELLCHDCGWTGNHLGLHAWKAHGIPASDYRERHGLKRSRGLISPHTRATIRAIAANRINPNLAAARDPAAALQIHLAHGATMSPEAVAARDKRIAQIGRSTRKVRVVTCPECGITFCPLTQTLHRRFCSRSCASRYRHRIRRTEPRDPPPKPT